MAHKSPLSPLPDPLAVRPKKKAKYSSKKCMTCGMALDQDGECPGCEAHEKDRDHKNNLEIKLSILLPSSKCS